MGEEKSATQRGIGLEYEEGLLLTIERCLANKWGVLIETPYIYIHQDSSQPVFPKDAGSCFN